MELGTWSGIGSSLARVRLRVPAPKQGHNGEPWLCEKTPCYLLCTAPPLKSIRWSYTLESPIPYCGPTLAVLAAFPVWSLWYLPWVFYFLFGDEAPVFLTLASNA